jgi:hypothetical protein
VSTERFSVGFETVPTGLAAGGVYATLLAGASDPISIRTLRVTNTGSVGIGPVALARAAGVGTGVTVYTGVGHRTLGASGAARAYSAWNGSNPSGALARLACDAVPAGTGTMRELWNCETQGPLVLEPRGGLTVLNHGSGIASGTLYINATWEEGRR